jgi:hypothetical protein
VLPRRSANDAGNPLLRVPPAGKIPNRPSPLLLELRHRDDRAASVTTPSAWIRNDHCALRGYNHYGGCSANRADPVGDDQSITAPGHQLVRSCRRAG